MESISRIIGKLDVPERPLSAEQTALSAWPRAVGKKIASHTRATKMVRTRLVVEVEDALWQRNLFLLSRHILANLERALGQGIVEDVEFRIVPPRRAPQRAATAVSLDEADQIADPVLRHIYKAARYKETA